MYGRVLECGLTLLASTGVRGLGGVMSWIHASTRHIGVLSGSTCCCWGQLDEPRSSPVHEEETNGGVDGVARWLSVEAINVINILR